jgi:hypothetical protein
MDSVGQNPEAREANYEKVLDSLPVFRDRRGGVCCHFDGAFGKRRATACRRAACAF